MWMGEFGRTPKINPNAGRDHFPKVFNVALAGGGVKGGQVIGASNADGTDVKDHPVSVPDLLASLCHTLKVDPTKEMMTPIGRPDQDRRRRQVRGSSLLITTMLRPLLLDRTGRRGRCGALWSVARPRPAFVVRITRACPG